MSSDGGRVTQRTGGVIKNDEKILEGTHSNVQSNDCLIEKPVSCQPTQQAQAWLPCLYHDLQDCLEEFPDDEFENWLNHSLSHFDGHGPPSRCMCIFCDQIFEGGDRFVTWTLRMKHIRQHLAAGDSFEGRLPDYEELKHLKKFHLMDIEIYRYALIVPILRPERSPWLQRVRNDEKKENSSWCDSDFPDEVQMNASSIPHLGFCENALRTSSSSFSGVGSEEEIETGQDLQQYCHSPMDGHLDDQPSWADEIPDHSEASLRIRFVNDSEISTKNLEVSSVLNLYSQSASASPWSPFTYSEVHYGPCFPTLKLPVMQVDRYEDTSSYTDRSRISDVHSESRGDLSRIMAMFWEIMNTKGMPMIEIARLHVRERGNPGESSSTSSFRHPKQSQCSRNSTSAVKHGHGKSRRRSSTDQNDDDQRAPKQRKQSSTAPEDVADMLPFACFYRKNNRLVYNCRDYEICALHSWTSIHRLKEHLYRVHRAGPQCPRCYFAAESQEALVIHAQAIPSCMPRSCEQPKGSSLPQEERIRRKTRRGVLPHQAWFDIFAILFPDSVPPETPYFEEVVDKTLPEMPGFETFLLQEVPRRYRELAIDSLSRFSDSTSIVEELAEALTDMLSALIADCTREYQQRLITSTDHANVAHPLPSLNHPTSAVFTAHSSYPTSNACLSSQESTTTPDGLDAFVEWNTSQPAGNPDVEGEARELNTDNNSRQEISQLVTEEVTTDTGADKSIGAYPLADTEFDRLFQLLTDHDLFPQLDD